MYVPCETYVNIFVPCWVQWTELVQIDLEVLPMICVNSKSWKEVFWIFAILTFYN